jgi:hypothetical protein
MKRLRSLLVVVATLALPGCADLIAVERSLTEQASHGVELARDAIDERDKLIAAHRAEKRRALDNAFDHDVRDRAEQLDADWVITHRKAYAIGLGVIDAESQSVRERTATDRANLDATTDALRRLRAIQDAKLNLISKGARP